MNNVAGGEGGGIYAWANDAEEPCPPWVLNSAIIVMNSLVAGNVAQGTTLPIYRGDGGAIWHLGGYLNLGNSTFVNNIAAGHGGGVYTDRCIESFIYNSGQKGVGLTY